MCPTVNYIDAEVFGKLRRLNMVPSDLSSDNEFLRRVTIDTIGTLPTPKEVREFLADTAPDKRTRKIDELLAHPMHAALWATKFSDITGNNTDALETNFIPGNQQQTRPRLSQAWHDWFRKRVAENMPYDEIVRNVLTATSRDGKSVDDYLNREPGCLRGDGQGFQHPLRREKVTRPVLAPSTADSRRTCGDRRPPPRSWAFGSNVPSATSIHSIVGPRSITAPTGTSSPGSRSACNQMRTKAFQAEVAKRNGDKTGKNGNQNVQVREVFFGSTGGGKGRGQGALPHPETNAPLAPKALGGPEVKQAMIRASSCSTGCARRTIRSSPAASSIASGATT